MHDNIDYCRWPGFWGHCKDCIYSTPYHENGLFLARGSKEVAVHDGERYAWRIFKNGVMS